MCLQKPTTALSGNAKSNEQIANSNLLSKILSTCTHLVFFLSMTFAKCCLNQQSTSRLLPRPSDRSADPPTLVSMPKTPLIAASLKWTHWSARWASKSTKWKLINTEQNWWIRLPKLISSEQLRSKSRSKIGKKKKNTNNKHTKKSESCIGVAQPSRAHSSKRLDLPSKRAWSRRRFGITWKSLSCRSTTGRLAKHILGCIWLLLGPNRK